MEIEALRAYGNSYRTIMEALPEDAAVRRSQDGTTLISVQHFTNRVSAHMKRHAAFEKAVAARIVDRCAEQQGLDVTGAVDTLLTVPGHLQSVMQRAHESIVNGAPVSPRDGIAAAKALLDFEAKHQTDEIDAVYYASVVDRLDPTPPYSAFRGERVVAVAVPPLDLAVAALDDQLHPLALRLRSRGSFCFGLRRMKRGGTCRALLLPSPSSVWPGLDLDRRSALVSAASHSRLLVAARQQC